jgi:hypothetical protein
VEQVNAAPGVAAVQLLWSEQAEDGTDAHAPGLLQPRTDGHAQLAAIPPARLTALSQTTPEQPEDLVTHGWFRLAGEAVQPRAT